MKKILLLALVALALVLGFAGCNKGKAPLVTPAQGGSAQADPHAGTAPAEVPAGVGHKAKVLDFVDAAGYTYIQVEENGKKFWLAAVQAKVAKGDEIEFADSPVFPTFQSKALNRTFENLMMVAGIRNNGKK